MIRSLLSALSLALACAALPPAPARAGSVALPPGAAVPGAGARPAGSSGDSARPAPGAADSARQAGAAPAPVRARGRDYLAEARAGYGAENRAYNGARVVVTVVGPLYGVLCGLLLMFTGLSARFRDIGEALGHRLYVRVLVFFTLYSAAMFVLGLPLAWYEEYALEHEFGLSTQGFGGWLVDSFKGLATTIVAGGVVPLLALAWRAVEASPRRWWLWLAAGTLPVTLAAMLLEPVLLDPLFNRFVPLEDARLSAEILQLARRAGIPARHVYEVDMSRRTRKLNAYVDGFGASQRVVIWDTTLHAMTRDEILYVAAHEMGHDALQHAWKTLALVSLAAFAVFGLAARLVDAWLARFGTDWGVRGGGDLAALPVVALSLSLVTMAAMPAVNAVSRRAEVEADAFGLELTHDNDAAARAFLKLARDNRSDPDPPPLVRWLVYDHPPLADRIRFALGYRPWERGEPARFFRPPPRRSAG